MTVSMQLLFLLLLLLLGSQANHYYGTVMTFTPKERTRNGSLMVVFHYKLSFRSCTDKDKWNCISSDCGTERVELNFVDEEDNEWCQREGIMTREVSNNTSFFQLRLDGGDWVKTKNKVLKWKAVTDVNLRTRLDTYQPNRSPQTTILPVLRVPSNCQRDFSLLAFDPDGDKVKCRYGDTDADECKPCAPPAFLTISQACTLTFNSVGRRDEGSYAVQLEMEDFPTQTVNIRQSDEQTSITPTDPLSKIPIRFTLMVDPPVPSCSEGVYLPKFLPPTPANGAHLYTNDTVNITVMAEATNARILKLIYSGPHSVVKHAASHGEFILSWTPSKNEAGEDRPICFVVQAEENTAKYHSELRCVIVSFRTEPIITTPEPTTVPPSTTPESPSTLPFVTETEPLSNETVVLDEAKGSRQNHHNKTFGFCAEGWTRIHNHCYIYVSKLMTWAEAEKNCQSVNAHQASAQSLNEHHWIQQVIFDATRQNGLAWIGGSDAQQEGFWFWIDEEKFTYTNWCPGEPNNNLGTQHCLQMNYSENKCWDDQFCDAPLPSVCVQKME